MAFWNNRLQRIRAPELSDESFNKCEQILNIWEKLKRETGVLDWSLGDIILWQNSRIEELEKEGSVVSYEARLQADRNTIKNLQDKCQELENKLVKRESKVIADYFAHRRENETTNTNTDND